MKRKIVVPILCIALALGMLSGCVEEEEEPTNEAPVAGFTTPENIYVNVEFAFTDTSTDDVGVVSWSWDFDGDGVEDSSDMNPTHAYDTVGEKTVILTVTDDEGETGDYTATITVMYMPPTAMFTYEPMVNITVNVTTVEFTDTSIIGDANITSWMWDFGDGTNSTDQNATHMYNTTGTFTVSLTVTDANGETDTYEVTIEAIEES